jgi:hypothetical protein
MGEIMGKSRVLAKKRIFIFRGKTGFYLPLPVKPRFTHKPEKFPGVGGIG